MEMKGSQTVAATVERTWQGLNDPETLKACIPGCEALEPAGDNAWTVVMNLKIGPVGARFKGKLALSNVQEPRSYTIQFEGQGGAAGFGKGSADVTLSPVAEGTLLEYGVNAQIGGRIAQVGARLVDSAAKKMADDFFARFNKVMAEGAAGGEAASAASAEVAPAASAGGAAAAMPDAALAPGAEAASGAAPGAGAGDSGAQPASPAHAAASGQAVASAQAAVSAAAPAPVLGDAAAVQAAAVPPSPGPAGVPPLAGPAAVPQPAAVPAAAAPATPAAATPAAATPAASGKPAWLGWLLAIIVVFVLYLMFRG